MPVFMTGETFDLSDTGIAFVVSSIRIMENYLVGQERILIAELDLPGGKVTMKLLGRRYEQVGVHLSTEKYLIGAEIVEISDSDREMYEHFIRSGPTRPKAAAQMQLGID
jgi:c-di-GMP-binding flagellar brake protein YcgR